MRLLRSLVAALVAALSVVVVTATPSFACSCAGGDAADFVDRADVVVTGTVVEITPPPDRLVMSSTDPATYTVDVDGVLEGSAGPTVEVLSAVSGASCGLEGVREGGRYVVFAAHQTIEGQDTEHLWANLCGGTGPATADFVDEVEAVTGPAQPPAVAGTGSAPEVGYEPPKGASLAAPLALGAGGALVLLVAMLWLRLRLTR